MKIQRGYFFASSATQKATLIVSQPSIEKIKVNVEKLKNNPVLPAILCPDIRVSYSAYSELLIACGLVRGPSLDDYIVLVFKIFLQVSHNVN